MGTPPDSPGSGAAGPLMTQRAASLGLRILVLAPHPFLIDRGTPIDLGLVLRALSLRGMHVDVVCYAEGQGTDLPGITLHRIPDRAIFRGMRPGFSLRKVLADAYLFQKARRLAAHNHYDLIHAGEEAVFLAQWLERDFSIPYVYDLDSSIAQQMVEKMPWMRPFRRVLDRCEGAAVRGALGCLPVCNALGDLCRRHGSRNVEVLHDITLLDEEELGTLRQTPPRSLREETGIPPDDLLAMYVGNLEPYQGVDLLLDAMVVLNGPAPTGTSGPPRLHLVVVGGRADDIARARHRIRGTAAEARVHFLGPRPVGQLASLLVQGDILVAPRIRGLNTPMKVFSYLHTGRCVLVTDLPTHTQVLDARVCALAKPTPAAFAQALAQLAADPAVRDRLGAAGRAYVLEHHTFDAYRRRLDHFYDEVANLLEARRPHPGGPHPAPLAESLS